jgi:hypothetical protein
MVIALSYHGLVPTEVEKAAKINVFGLIRTFGAPYGRELSKWPMPIK